MNQLKFKKYLKALCFASAIMAMMFVACKKEEAVKNNQTAVPLTKFETVTIEHEKVKKIQRMIDEPENPGEYTEEWSNKFRTYYTSLNYEEFKEFNKYFVSVEYQALLGLGVDETEALHDANEKYGVRENLNDQAFRKYGKSYSEMGNEEAKSLYKELNKALDLINESEQTAINSNIDPNASVADRSACKGYVINSEWIGSSSCGCILPWNWCTDNVDSYYCLSAYWGATGFKFNNNSYSKIRLSSYTCATAWNPALAAAWAVLDDGWQKIEHRRRIGTCNDGSYYMLYTLNFPVTNQIIRKFLSAHGSGGYVPICGCTPLGPGPGEYSRSEMQQMSAFLSSQNMSNSFRTLVDIYIKHQTELNEILESKNIKFQAVQNSFINFRKAILPMIKNAFGEENKKPLTNEHIQLAQQFLIELNKVTTSEELSNNIMEISKHLPALEGKALIDTFESFDQMGEQFSN